MNSLPSLHTLQQAVCAWSDETFPGQPTTGKIRHLIKEANELLENPSDKVEIADCQILLVDIARRAGMTADDLIRVAFQKLEVCKQRKWSAPDEHGTVESPASWGGE